MNFSKGSNMSDIKTEVTQVAIEHPMENIFDLERGSTLVERVVMAEPDEVIEPTIGVYDEKDQEIDNQFQQVFNAAYMTFEAQRMSTEGMNPQFQARALEVAQQFLNTALAAASEKAKLKQAKDKIVKPTGTVNNTTNNLIMDRDDMLKMLLAQKEQQVRTIEEE